MKPARKNQRNLTRCSEGTTDMSLDISGADKSVQPGAVTILVGKEHPLIMLANALPWAILISLAMEDLKRTTVKGYWWLGRRLLVRVHVAAYILQKFSDLTDREVEYGLRDNAAYQLFAGKGIVANWHAPDHTKIAAFRSRSRVLTPSKRAKYSRFTLGM